MKTLIVIRRSPAKRFLVDIPSTRVSSEFENLIARSKYSKAMVLAFTKGKFMREVLENELPSIKVDLILTEHNASWDLIK